MTPSTKFISRFTFAVALATFVTLAVLTFAEEAKRIKFELLKSGHICVSVKINDRGPFRLGLDTGSPQTFISTRLAKELGFADDVAGGQPGRGFGGMGFPRANRVTLQIGDLRVENVPLTTLDHPTVDLIGKAQGGLDGLIGLSFLRNYRMTIDYETREITLKPIVVAEDPRAAMANFMTGRALLRGPQGRAAIIGAAIEEMAAGGDEAQIAFVARGGAAEAGGLKVGDKIVSINGRWVTNTEDFARAINALPPGVPAEFIVRRDSETVKLMITPKPGL